MTNDELRNAIEEIIDDCRKQGENYESESGNMEYYEVTDSYAASVRIMALIDENRITRNPGLNEAVDFAKKGIEAVTILFNNLKSKQREKVYFPGDLRAKGDKLFGLL